MGTQARCSTSRRDREKFRDKLKRRSLRELGRTIDARPSHQSSERRVGTLSSMAHLAKKQSSRNNTTSPNCGVDLFDVVIIDEASQAVEPATLIPLRWLKPDGLIVLVDDCQQLDRRSFLGAAIKPTTPRVCSTSSKTGLPSFTLQEQYRMHPSIVRFPSLRFYEHLYPARCGATMNSAVPLQGELQSVPILQRQTWTDGHRSIQDEF